MILERVELQGFRSHQNTILDMPLVATIIGPVGGGKSSLQESFRLAAYGETDTADPRGHIRLGSDRCRVLWIFKTLGGLRYRIVLNQVVKGSDLDSDLQFTQEVPDLLHGHPWWKPLGSKRIRETRAKIREIIGCDYDTLISSAICPQGSSAHFTRPPKVFIDGRYYEGRAARIQILAQSEGLGIWEERRKVATKEGNEVDTKASTLETQVAVADSTLASRPETEDALCRAEAGIQSYRRSGQQTQDAIEALTGQWATLQAEIEAGRRQCEGLAADERGMADLEASRSTKERTRDRYQGILDHRQEITSKAAKSEVLIKQADALRVELAGIEAEIKGLESQKAPAEGRLKVARKKLFDIQTRLAGIQKRLSARKTQEAKVAQIIGARQDREVVAASIQATDEQIATARSSRDIVTGANAIAQEERGRILTEEEKVRTQTEGLLPLIQGHEKRTSLMDIVPCLGESQAVDLRLWDRCPLLADARASVGPLADLRTQHVGLCAWRCPPLPDIQPTDALDGTLRTLTAQKAQQQGRLTALEAEIRALTPAEAELAALDTLAGEVPRLEGEERTARTEVDGLIEAVTRLEIETAAHRGGTLNKKAELGGVSEQIRDMAKWILLVPEIGLAERELPGIEADLATLAGQITAISKRIEEVWAVQTALAVKQKALDETHENLEAQRASASHARANEQAATDAAAQHRAALASLDKLAGERETAAKEAAELRTRHSLLVTLALAYRQIPIMTLETQAVPEIEEEANRILTRISQNGMRTELRTLREVKAREELADGLDIIITDRVGTRSYEDFSFGQKWQVDFAYRIAQTKRQARRKAGGIGCRWIDEGFGTQDTGSLQAVIEVLREMQHETPQLLITSHVEGLRDTFPTRIEVSGGPEDSHAEMVVG